MKTSIYKGLPSWPCLIDEGQLFLCHPFLGQEYVDDLERLDANLQGVNTAQTALSPAVGTLGATGGTGSTLEKLPSGSIEDSSMKTTQW
jgi:hypothetical protein